MPGERPPSVVRRVGTKTLDGVEITGCRAIVRMRAVTAAERRPPAVV
jgi:hypothetical protein